MSRKVTTLRNTSDSPPREVENSFSRYSDLLQEDESTSCPFTVSEITKMQHYNKAVKEQDKMESSNDTKKTFFILILTLFTLCFATVAALMMTNSIGIPSLLGNIKQRMSLNNMVILNSIAYRKFDGLPPSYSIYANNKDKLGEDTVPIVVDVSGKDWLLIPTALSKCLGYKPISTGKSVSRWLF